VTISRLELFAVEGGKEQVVFSRCSCQVNGMAAHLLGTRARCRCSACRPATATDERGGEGPGGLGEVLRTGRGRGGVFVAGKRGGVGLHLCTTSYRRHIMVTFFSAPGCRNSAPAFGAQKKKELSEHVYDL
jgi:hypothetical protein